MGSYLVINHSGVVDEKLFMKLKEIAEIDSNATISIVDRSNLPVAEFWSDEKVKAFVRRRCVELMAKLERECAPEPKVRYELPQAAS